MKYIDADKLIAEIERHIKHYEKLDRDDFKNGELYICQELLSFIKSLQQEQVEVDVEKEIEDYAYSLPHSTTGSSAYVSDKRLPIARQFGIKHAWSFEHVMEIAMHSYGLGFNARK